MSMRSRQLGRCIVGTGFLVMALIAGVVEPGHSQPTSDVIPQPLQHDQRCLTSRPLNPPPQSSLGRRLEAIESLDFAFANAFMAANAGQFQAAVYYYKKAMDLDPCSCGKQHAAAGIKAASMAGSLLEQEGWRSRPTQVFWSQLQHLTQDLPCVKRN